MNNKPKCKIQTIKLLEDNTEENLVGLGYGNDFLDITPKALAITDTPDFFKNFCSTQNNVKRMRR